MPIESSNGASCCPLLNPPSSTQTSPRKPPEEEDEPPELKTPPPLLEVNPNAILDEALELLKSESDHSFQKLAEHFQVHFPKLSLTEEDDFLHAVNQALCTQPLEYNEEQFWLLLNIFLQPSSFDPTNLDSFHELISALPAAENLKYSTIFPLLYHLIANLPEDATSKALFQSLITWVERSDCTKIPTEQKAYILLIFIFLDEFGLPSNYLAALNTEEISQIKEIIKTEYLYFYFLRRLENPEYITLKLLGEIIETEAEEIVPLILEQGAQFSETLFLCIQKHLPQSPLLRLDKLCSSPGFAALVSKYREISSVQAPFSIKKPSKELAKSLLLLTDDELEECLNGLASFSRCSDWFGNLLLDCMTHNLECKKFVEWLRRKDFLGTILLNFLSEEKTISPGFYRLVVELAEEEIKTLAGMFQNPSFSTQNALFSLILAHANDYNQKNIEFFFTLAGIRKQSFYSSVSRVKGLAITKIVSFPPTPEGEILESMVKLFPNKEKFASIIKDICMEKGLLTPPKADSLFLLEN